MGQFLNFYSDNANLTYCNQKSHIEPYKILKSGVNQINIDELQPFKNAKIYKEMYGVQMPYIALYFEMALSCSKVIQ